MERRITDLAAPELLLGFVATNGYCTRVSALVEADKPPLPRGYVKLSIVRRLLQEGILVPGKEVGTEQLLVLTNYGFACETYTRAKAPNAVQVEGSESDHGVVQGLASVRQAAATGSVESRNTDIHDDAPHDLPAAPEEEVRA
jgi:hypothetical protein